MPLNLATPMKSTTVRLFAMLALTGAACTQAARGEDKLAKLEARLKSLEKEIAVLRQVGKVIKSGNGEIIVQHDTLTGGSSESVKEYLNNSKWKDDLDRPITTSPAAFVIGSGEQVPEVSNIRALAGSAITGLNPQGKIQNGFAVSMNIGSAWDYVKYGDGYKHVGKLNDERTVKAYFDRLVYRSTFSIATTKAQNSADPSVHLAVGLGAILYDHLDPGLGSDGNSKEHPSGKSEPQRVKELMGVGVGDEHSQIHLALQNRRLRSGVSIGIVPTFAAANGKIGNLGYDGYTVYLAATALLNWEDVKHLTLAKPIKLEEYSLGLSAVAKWKGDEQWTDPLSKAIGRQNSANFAGRISYGTPEANGAVEAGYVQVYGGPRSHQSAWQVNGNLTFHVAKDIYFVINAGQKLAGDGEFFSTGGFQIGASDQTGPSKQATP